MSSQRRQPTGHKKTVIAEGATMISPTYAQLTGFQPVNQFEASSSQQPRVSSSKRSPSKLPSDFVVTTSQQKIKQATPGLNPSKQSSRSSKIAPTGNTLQSHGATTVVNNPLAEGGRKKKPVSKPKNKKMTSPKKKQVRK